MPVSYEVKNRAVPILSQAVDQYVGGLQQKARERRQDQIREQGFAREDMIRQEGQQREDRIRRQNMMANLINQQLGRKDLTPEGRQAAQEALMGVIQDPDYAIGAGDQLSEALAPNVDMVDTPPWLKQHFPTLKDQIPASKLKAFIDAAEQHGVLQKQQAEIRTEGARTQKELNLAKKYEADAKRIRQDMNRPLSETHLKAKILDKGLKEGFENLSNDERRIIGLDRMDRLLKTMQMFEQMTYDWEGNVREGITKQDLRRYESMRKLYQEAVARQIPGAGQALIPDGGGTPGDGDDFGDLENYLEGYKGK